ncbi:MAG: DUF1624 domain-containing protein [Bdellovibrionales bacterium]|nr:DUF1624 domain-containing protein [Bdellovibrionales bacterium]
MMTYTLSMNKRIGSVDAFRALAIIKMLLCHFVLYLSADREPNSWIVLSLCGPYASFGAQFFTFTVGLSFYFSDKKHWADGRSHGFKHHMRRAGLIFLIGIIFSILAWSFDGALDWDILTLIAFSIFVLALVRKLPSSFILLLAVSVILAAPFLRGIADFDSYWRHETFEYAARWDGLHDLVGFLVTGYFPVFPWLFFPLSGYLVARGIFEESGRGTIWARGLFVLGLVLVVLGPLLQLLGNSANFNLRGSFYPLSTFRLLASIGLCLLVFVCFHFVFDIRGRHVPQYFESMSRSSLTLYLAHHFLILWPLWIIGALDEDVAKYFQKSMEPYLALLLGLAFLLLWIPISKAWKARGYRFGAEWALKYLT